MFLCFFSGIQDYWVVFVKRVSLFCNFFIVVIWIVNLRSSWNLIILLFLLSSVLVFIEHVQTLRYLIRHITVWILIRRFIQRGRLAHFLPLFFRAFSGGTTTHWTAVDVPAFFRVFFLSSRSNLAFALSSNLLQGICIRLCGACLWNSLSYLLFQNLKIFLFGRQDLGFFGFLLFLLSHDSLQKFLRGFILVLFFFKLPTRHVKALILTASLFEFTRLLFCLGSWKCVCFFIND